MAGGNLEKLRALHPEFTPRAPTGADLGQINPLHTDQQRGLDQRNEFQKGVESGFGQVEAGLLADRAGVGAMLGEDPARTAELMDDVNLLNELSMEFGPSVNSIQDVNVDNFMDYAAGMFGQQGVVMGTMLAGGAGAAGAASGLARIGGRKMLRNATSRALRDIRKTKAAKGLTRADNELMKGMAKKEAAQKLHRIAGGTGGFATESRLEAGNIFSEIYNDPEASGDEKSQAATAAVFGMMGASLSQLSAVKALKNLNLKRKGSALPKDIERAITENMVSRMGRDTVEQILMEAPEEAFQEFIALAGHKWVNDNIELFDEEAIIRYLDGAVAGGLVSGGIGASTSLAGSMGQRMLNRIEAAATGEKTLDEQLEDPSDVPEPETDPNAGLPPGSSPNAAATMPIRKVFDIFNSLQAGDEIGYVTSSGDEIKGKIVAVNEDGTVDIKPQGLRRTKKGVNLVGFRAEGGQFSDDSIKRADDLNAERFKNLTTDFSVHMTDPETGLSDEYNVVAASNGQVILEDVYDENDMPYVFESIDDLREAGATAITEYEPDTKVHVKTEMASETASKPKPKSKGKAKARKKPEQVAKGVQLSEGGSYEARTKENARKSDVTIAVADDFTSPGEKLTASSAGNKIVQTRHRENQGEGFNLTQAVREIAAKLPKDRPAVINGAGNTSAKLTGGQKAADERAFQILNRLIDSGVKIKQVRSGGQTGYDIAFARAAKRLGIPVLLHVASDAKGNVITSDAKGNAQRTPKDQYTKKALATRSSESEPAVKARDAKVSVADLLKMKRRTQGQFQTKESGDTTLRVKMQNIVDEVHKLNREMKTATDARKEYLTGRMQELANRYSNILNKEEGESGRKLEARRKEAARRKAEIDRAEAKQKASAKKERKLKSKVDISAKEAEDYAEIIRETQQTRMEQVFNENNIFAADLDLDDPDYQQQEAEKFRQEPNFGNAEATESAEVMEPDDTPVLDDLTNKVKVNRVPKVPFRTSMRDRVERYNKVKEDLRGMYGVYEHLMTGWKADVKSLREYMELVQKKDPQDRLQHEKDLFGDDAVISEETVLRNVNAKEGETLDSFEVEWRTRTTRESMPFPFLLTPAHIANMQTEPTKAEKRARKGSGHEYVTIGGFRFSPLRLLKIVRARVQEVESTVFEGLNDVQKIQRALIMGLTDLQAQEVLQVTTAELERELGPIIVGLTGGDRSIPVPYDVAQFDSAEAQLIQAAVSGKAFLYNRYIREIRDHYYHLTARNEKGKFIHSAESREQAKAWFKAMDIDPNKVHAVDGALQNPTDFHPQYRTFIGKNKAEQFYYELGQAIMDIRNNHTDPTARASAYEWLDRYGIDGRKLRKDPSVKVREGGVVNKKMFDEALEQYIGDSSIFANYIYFDYLTNVDREAVKVGRREREANERRGVYDRLVSLLADFDALPQHEKVQLTRAKKDGPIMNVWWGKNADENARFSNLAERPFSYEGRTYKTVEHAYQSLKSGEFDQKVYDDPRWGPGVRVRGKKVDLKGRVQLMTALMTESFLQNPKDLKALQETGDVPITHGQDAGFWGKKFPYLLMKIRGNVNSHIVPTRAGEIIFELRDLLGVDPEQLGPSGRWLLNTARDTKKVWNQEYKYDEFTPDLLGQHKKEADENNLLFDLGIVLEHASESSSHATAYAEPSAEGTRQMFVNATNMAEYIEDQLQAQVDRYGKKQGYDLNNLTSEQIKDMQRYRDRVGGQKAGDTLQPQWQEIVNEVTGVKLDPKVVNRKYTRALNYAKKTSDRVKAESIEEQLNALLDVPADSWTELKRGLTKKYGKQRGKRRLVSAGKRGAEVVPVTDTKGGLSFEQTGKAGQGFIDINELIAERESYSRSKSLTNVRPHELLAVHQIVVGTTAGENLNIRRATMQKYDPKQPPAKEDLRGYMREQARQMRQGTWLYVDPRPLDEKQGKVKGIPYPEGMPFVMHEYVGGKVKRLRDFLKGFTIEEYKEGGNASETYMRALREAADLLDKMGRLDNKTRLAMRDGETLFKKRMAVIALLDDTVNNKGAQREVVTDAFDLRGNRNTVNRLEANLDHLRRLRTRQKAEVTDRLDTVSRALGSKDRLSLTQARKQVTAMPDKTRKQVQEKNLMLALMAQVEAEQKNIKDGEGRFQAEIDNLQVLIERDVKSLRPDFKVQNQRTLEEGAARIVDIENNKAKEEVEPMTYERIKGKTLDSHQFIITERTVETYDDMILFLDFLRTLQASTIDSSQKRNSTLPRPLQTKQAIGQAPLNYKTPGTKAREQKQADNVSTMKVDDNSTLYSAHAGRTDGLSDESMQEIADLVETISDRTPEFEDDLDTAGRFDRVRKIITIATHLNHVEGMDTAAHEAFHAVMETMMTPAEIKMLTKWAKDPDSMDRILAFYRAKGVSVDGLNNMRAAMTPPADGLYEITSNWVEERAAYAFGAYYLSRSGLIDQPPFNLTKPVETLFEKIVQALKHVLGVFHKNEGAQYLFSQVLNGNIKNQYATGAPRHHTYQSPGTTQVPKAVTVGATKAWRAMSSVMDSFLTPADMAIRKTGNPALIALADRLFKSPLYRTDKANKDTFIEQQRIRFQEFFATFEQEWRRIPPQMQTELKTAMYQRKSRDQMSPELQIHYDWYRNFMDGVYEYAKEEGAKLGSIDFYHPVVWDQQKVTDHKAEFIQMLRDHPDQEAVNKFGGPERIWSNIIKDPSVFEQDMPFAQVEHAAKTRDYAFLNDTDLSMFLVDDFEQVMHNYIGQITRHVEFARFFGDEGQAVTRLLEKAERQGATPQEIQMATDYVLAARNKLGAGINPRWANFTNVMVTYQNFRVLGMAVFASLVEPMALAVRTGDPSIWWQGMKTAGREIAAYSNSLPDRRRIHKRLKTLAAMPTLGAAEHAEYASLIQEQQALTTEQRKFARDMGVLDMGFMTDTVMMMNGAQEMTGWTARMNEWLFRWNGLQSWTNLTKVMAAQGAVAFIAKEKRRGEQSRFLTELNLKLVDITLDSEGNLLTDAAAIMARRNVNAATAAHMAALTKDAIFRFVEETALRPNAGTRPVKGSDPHFALFYHLTPFIYTMQTQVVNRVLREAFKHGNYTPALFLMSFVPAMMAADMLRGVVQYPFGDEDEDDESGLWGSFQKSAVRSGAFGLIEPMVGAYNNANRFGGTGVEALGGPAVGQGAEFARSIFGGSPSFNSTLKNALPLNNVYRQWF